MKYLALFMSQMLILEELEIKKSSHRVHKDESVGRSIQDAVGVLVSGELKAEGVSHTSLQTHRLRRDHEPGANSQHTVYIQSFSVYVSLHVFGATNLAPADMETMSLSSSGMVFPQGLLVGIGPGRITVIRTSSQSRGIWIESVFCMVNMQIMKHGSMTL